MPLISALILTFASCSHGFFENNGQTWGTTYHIVYSSPVSLEDSIIGIMRFIDNELSVFNASSTVRAVNENRLDSVGEDFRSVFECAQRVNALSGGKYDPTIAPLADLWGFGPSGDVEVPSDSALVRALAVVGIDSCFIDDSGHITKRNPATAFDFSSLAKGYGVDCIARMLERNGVENYMVEIGGEISARGLNRKGSPWRIQIDAPVEDVLHQRLSVIELGPELGNIASSGNYRNYRTAADGSRYGHTINPRTGRPVQTSVLATSISAADCMTADALATAAMCLPPDSALNMLAEAGANGMLVVAKGDSISIVLTPSFP